MPDAARQEATDDSVYHVRATSASSAYASERAAVIDTTPKEPQTNMAARIDLHEAQNDPQLKPKSAVTVAPFENVSAQVYAASVGSELLEDDTSVSTRGVGPSLGYAVSFSPSFVKRNAIWLRSPPLSGTGGPSLPNLDSAAPRDDYQLHAAALMPATIGQEASGCDANFKTIEERSPDLGSESAARTIMKRRREQETDAAILHDKTTSRGPDDETDRRRAAAASSTLVVAVTEADRVSSQPNAPPHVEDGQAHLLRPASLVATSLTIDALHRRGRSGIGGGSGVGRDLTESHDGNSGAVGIVRRNDVRPGEQLRSSQAANVAPSFALRSSQLRPAELSGKLRTSLAESEGIVGHATQKSGESEAGIPTGGDGGLEKRSSMRLQHPRDVRAQNDLVGASGPTRATNAARQTEDLEIMNQRITIEPSASDGVNASVSDSRRYPGEAMLSDSAGAMSSLNARAAKRLGLSLFQSAADRTSDAQAVRGAPREQTEPLLDLPQRTHTAMLEAELEQAGSLRTKRGLDQPQLRNEARNLTEGSQSNVPTSVVENSASLLTGRPRNESLLRSSLEHSDAVAAGQRQGFGRSAAELGSREAALLTEEPTAVAARSEDYKSSVSDVPAHTVDPFPGRISGSRLVGVRRETHHGRSFVKELLKMMSAAAVATGSLPEMSRLALPFGVDSADASEDLHDAAAEVMKAIEEYEKYVASEELINSGDRYSPGNSWGEQNEKVPDPELVLPQYLRAPPQTRDVSAVNANCIADYDTAALSAMSSRQHSPYVGRPVFQSGSGTRPHVSTNESPWHRQLSAHSSVTMQRSNKVDAIFTVDTGSVAAEATSLIAGLEENAESNTFGQRHGRIPSAKAGDKEYTGTQDRSLFTSEICPTQPETRDAAVGNVSYVSGSNEERGWRAPTNEQSARNSAKAFRPSTGQVTANDNRTSELRGSPRFRDCIPAGAYPSWLSTTQQLEEQRATLPESHVTESRGARRPAADAGAGRFLVSVAKPIDSNREVDVESGEKQREVSLAEQQDHRESSRFAFNEAWGERGNAMARGLRVASESKLSFASAAAGGGGPGPPDDRLVERDARGLLQDASSAIELLERARQARVPRGGDSTVPSPIGHGPEAGTPSQRLLLASSRNREPCASEADVGGVDAWIAEAATADPYQAEGDSADGEGTSPGLAAGLSSALLAFLAKDERRSMRGDPPEEPVLSTEEVARMEIAVVEKRLAVVKPARTEDRTVNVGPRVTGSEAARTAMPLADPNRRDEGTAAAGLERRLPSGGAKIGKWRPPALSDPNSAGALQERLGWASGSAESRRLSGSRAANASEEAMAFGARQKRVTKRTAANLPDAGDPQSDHISPLLSSDIARVLTERRVSDHHGAHEKDARPGAAPGYAASELRGRTRSPHTPVVLTGRREEADGKAESHRGIARPPREESGCAFRYDRVGQPTPVSAYQNSPPPVASIATALLCQTLESGRARALTVTSESVDGCSFAPHYDAAYLGDSVAAMSAKSAQIDSADTDSWQNQLQRSSAPPGGSAAMAIEFDVASVGGQPPVIADIRAGSLLALRLSSERESRRTSSSERVRAPKRTDAGRALLSPRPNSLVLTSENVTMTKLVANDFRRSTALATAMTSGDNSGWGKSNNRKNTSDLTSNIARQLADDRGGGNGVGHRRHRAEVAKVGLSPMEFQARDEDAPPSAPKRTTNLIATSYADASVASEGEQFDTAAEGPDRLPTLSEDSAPEIDSFEQISGQGTDSRWNAATEQDISGLDEGGDNSTSTGVTKSRAGASIRFAPQHSQSYGKSKLRRRPRFGSSSSSASRRRPAAAAAAAAPSNGSTPSLASDHSDVWSYSLTEDVSSAAHVLSQSDPAYCCTTTCAVLPIFFMVALPLISALVLATLWQPRSTTATDNFYALLRLLDICCSAAMLYW